jgi:hypothetical protein
MPKYQVEISVTQRYVIEVERWLVALRNGGTLNGKTLRVVLSELELKQ